MFLITQLSRRYNSLLLFLLITHWNSPSACTKFANPTWLESYISMQTKMKTNIIIKPTKFISGWFQQPSLRSSGWRRESLSMNVLPDFKVFLLRCLAFGWVWWVLMVVTVWGEIFAVKITTSTLHVLFGGIRGKLFWSFDQTWLLEVQVHFKDRNLFSTQID